MSGGAPSKPQFPLWDVAYAPHPAKNYMFQMLYHHIQHLAPARALDAGVGTLRNYWMFPGHYAGIGHNRAAYFLGANMKKNQKIIQKKGPPEVYLMRLESDFSFIGKFDLCVCTQTILYTDDRIDVVRRLSHAVKKGGALIVDDEIGMLDQYLAALTPDYEACEIIYWGYQGCNFKDHAMPAAEIIALSRQEMAAPNVSEGHAFFYLRALGKRVETNGAAPRPEIIDDRGLSIITRDIPRLRME